MSNGGPTPKTEMMQRLRDERRAKGIKKMELWLTQSERLEVEALMRRIRGK